MKTSVIDIYNAAASLYDETAPKFFRYFGRNLVSQVSIPAGAKVLDVASGKGAIALSVLEHQPLVQLCAIDLSDEMLRALKRATDALGVENIAIDHMDVEALDYGDEQFDFIFCGFALFIFSDIFRAFQEIYRVLKPGGVFAFSSFAQLEDHQILENLFARYFEEQDGIRKFSANPIAFHTLKGIQEFLRLGEFSDTRILSQTQAFIYPTFDDWWLKQWSHGMREDLLLLQQQGQLDAFRQDALQLLEQAKTQEGYRLEIQVHYTLAQKAI